MESILTTIKLMLGIAADYKYFDNVITVHINSVLMTLNQLGVGPEKSKFITNEMDTWEKVLGDIEDVEAVKTYVYLKVRMVFDPPASSAVMEAMKEQIRELEWRLNVQVENNKEE